MKIALVGNQNSGKTTLFNLLTGLNQKIGNWPGVTIERKSGTIIGTNYELVDLPGIYSLSPYTTEEEVSRRFVVEEKPDLIINIIDATSIERSLYLTTQLLELDIKVIIALNMSDIMEKKGVKIDVEKLSQEMNTTVVEISALKKSGIDKLINHIKEDDIKDNTHNKIYANDVEALIKKLQKNILGSHSRFFAVKAIENDLKFANDLHDKFREEIKELESNNSVDGEQLIADQRYQYIERIKEKAISIEAKGESITDKLDKVLINKWLSLPIFALIMFGVYYLSVGVIGTLTVEFIDSSISNLGASLAVFLSSINTSDWLISLIVDGIVAGVGAVLNFIPQLIILFLCISILETTGYMSRIAFILDRLFKKFGLSGKSLIPFIVGSGCSVPGIMTARTVEDEKERTMTIMLTPFIPCSAKLPIIALFAGYFFPSNSGIVTFSLYMFAIITILISAIVMKKFFFKGESSTFISELPEYKLPSAKYVIRDVWDKTISFVKRAGTIILLFSVMIWLMLSFSWSMEYGVDIENSILASIGNTFAWFFYPMVGEMNWGVAVSAIQGLVAKEQVVSSMAIISGLSSDIESGSLIFGSGSLFAFFTPASAYAYMVFNLFSAPCFGAIGAMKKELGSKRKTIIAVLFQTGLAWVLATIVFQIGRIIGG